MREEKENARCRWKARKRPCPIVLDPHSANPPPAAMHFSPCAFIHQRNASPYNWTNIGWYLCKCYVRHETLFACYSQLRTKFCGPECRVHMWVRMRERKRGRLSWNKNVRGNEIIPRVEASAVRSDSTARKAARIWSDVTRNYEKREEIRTGRNRAIPSVRRVPNAFYDLRWQTIPVRWC